jgi:hypothetical protein
MTGLEAMADGGVLPLCSGQSCKSARPWLSIEGLGGQL